MSTFDQVSPLPPGMPGAPGPQPRYGSLPAEGAPPVFARPSGFPVPGAEAPPPAPVIDDYWGAVETITEDVIWQGRARPVEFDILDADGENTLLQSIEQFPDLDPTIAAGVVRLALSIVSIGGKPLDGPTLADKVTLIRTWKGPLIDACLKAYDAATQRPFRKAVEYHADPNLETGLAGSGGPSASPVPGADAL